MLHLNLVAYFWMATLKYCETYKMLLFYRSSTKFVDLWWVLLVFCESYSLILLFRCALNKLYTQNVKPRSIWSTAELKWVSHYEEICPVDKTGKIIWPLKLSVVFCSILNHELQDETVAFNYKNHKNLWRNKSNLHGLKYMAISQERMRLSEPM